MKKLLQDMVTRALPKEKEYYLFDHQVKGLGCRILPNGLKSYYYRYTSPIDKKRKKIKIGDSNDKTLDEARIIAKKYSIEIYEKNDPSLLMKPKIEELNHSLLYGEFWNKFYKEYILENCIESTIYGNQTNFKKILDFFGKMELSKIEYEDIIKFKNTFDPNTTTPLTKSLGYLRKSFNYAEIWKLRPLNSNPCTHIKGKTSNKKERYLTLEEKSKIENYMENEIKKGSKISNTYYALLCLIYTGQRKNEIVKLKWEDVDLAEKIGTLHHHKTKKKVGKRTLVFNEEAISFFKRIPRKEDNPYIFCGRHVSKNSYLKNIDKTWRFVRKMFNLEDVRIHDLRHSFASFAINNGVNIYELSKLLGHSNIQTTQRYAHLYTDTLLKAANQVFKEQKG